MEKVDLVIVGAEGVVENGGIVNKLSTLTLAMSAKELGKPFYVAAESYKFTRLYPLNQSDLPDFPLVKPPLFIDNNRQKPYPFHHKSMFIVHRVIIHQPS